MFRGIKISLFVSVLLILPTQIAIAEIFLKMVFKLFYVYTNVNYV